MPEHRVFFAQIGFDRCRQDGYGVRHNEFPDHGVTLALVYRLARAEKPLNLVQCGTRTKTSHGIGETNKQGAFEVPKPELGTKRVCPETGRKFYDLNRDPIVSPYTGQTYPLTFFEGGEPEPEEEKAEEVEAETTETETENADVEIVSLEDADEEASDTGETIPDIDGDDDDDVELGDDDDDTFLETDDEDDDVSDIIAVSDDDEET